MTQKLLVSSAFGGTSTEPSQDSHLLAEMALDAVKLDSHTVLRNACWNGADAKDWVVIPKSDHGEFFRFLAFAIPSLIRPMKQLRMELAIPSNPSGCVLYPPRVEWVLKNSQFRPIHDVEEIARYEDGLRARLPVFEVFAKLASAAEDLEVKLAFSPARLAYQALSFLPMDSDTASPVTLSAFTVPGHSESLVFNQKPFLKSIRALPLEHPQSAERSPRWNRKQQLYNAQRRSVWKMIDHEQNAREFVECEDVEEIIAGLPLRFVGRAERTVKCAGGIIADAVGFGKTVVTLALIDFQKQEDGIKFHQREKAEKTAGQKALEATLIIVPEHITGQWAIEAETFLNLVAPKVFVIGSFQDLGPGSLKKLKDAEIIIASDKIFKDAKYRSRLGEWAGVPAIGNKYTERPYRAWHRMCMDRLKKNMRKFLTLPVNQSDEDLVHSIAEDLVSFQERNQTLLASMITDSSRKANKASGEVSKTMSTATEAGSTAAERAPVNKGATASKKGPARKKAPAKAVLMEDNKAVFKNGVVLEYFSYARVIWDEVSYASCELTEFVSSVSTQYKWLLSGTLPRQSLQDLSSLAQALNISLGRPAYVRLGLPRIAKSDTSSVQTETERCILWAKNMSDQWSTDRVARGHAFLETFSCSSPAATLAVKTEHHVIVTTLSGLDFAHYVETQEALRLSRMNLDTLTPDARTVIKRNLGTGNPTSDPYIIPKALIYGASLPDFANTGLEKLASYVERMRETLINAKPIVQRTFSKAVWLAHQLRHCAAWDKKEMQKLTLDLRQSVHGLEYGNFEFFDGVDGYLVTLKSIIPQLDLDRADVLAQANSGAGIDLVNLRSNILTPAPVRSPTEYMFTLDSLYQAGDYHWHDFYKVGYGDIAEFFKSGVRKTRKARGSGKAPGGRGGSAKEQQDTNVIPPEVVAKNNLVNLVTGCDTSKVSEPVKPEELASLDVDGLKKRFTDFIQELRGPKVEDDAFKDQPVEDLQHMCKSKKIVFTESHSAAELSKMLADDANGDLAPECYYAIPLAATQRVPVLDRVQSVRGTNVSETRTAFRDTCTKLTQAIKNVRTAANDLRRARVFQRLEKGRKYMNCDQCQKPGVLHLVFNCGHILCEVCCAGKDKCGDGAGACQSSLHRGTMPLELFGNSQLSEETLPSATPSTTPMSSLSDILSPNPKQEAKLPSKVQTIVDLVQAISEDDKVVIFTQYDGFMQRIMDALEVAGIVSKTTTARPNDNSEPSKVLEDFKKEGTFRVLIQQIDSSEAAGSNLTIANHVIFATPLVITSQDEYRSIMNQAEGRCRREKQTKDVHIYHCVTMGTFEVNLLELREKIRIGAKVGQTRGKATIIDTAQINAKHWCDGGNQGSKQWLEARSMLLDQEIWRATGETEYLTMLGTDAESCGVASATLRMDNLTIETPDGRVLSAGSSDTMDVAAQNSSSASTASLDTNDVMAVDTDMQGVPGGANDPLYD